VTRADETQQLWLDFRRTGDQKIRDRLILTYAPLVKYVAGRLGSGLPAHVDEGDLVSYGLLGLIGAIERYDPSRDVKFETYAMARIKGQIIDELRSMDWVPRSVRSRARQIERAIGELEARLGRAPTDEEIAKKLGMSEEELEESLSEIARSIWRARVRTERGTQSSERSSSMIAPRIRAIAKVSNLISREGSNRSIAPMSPSSPYETRSCSSTCDGRLAPRRPATNFTSGA